MTMGNGLHETFIRKATISSILILGITVGYFGAKIWSYSKKVEETKGEYLRVVVEFESQQAIRQISPGHHLEVVPIKISKEVNDRKQD